MAGQTRDKLTELGKKVEKAIQELKSRPYVKVGLPESKFSKKKKGSDGPASLGEVAVYNEFGTKTIPERSFIRATYDEKVKDWRAKGKKLITKVFMGEETVSSSTGKMGEVIKSDIQAKIRSGIAPKNRPSTLKRKEDKRAAGNTEPVKTLIDTGQLVQSITYEKHGID